MTTRATPLTPEDAQAALGAAPSVLTLGQAAVLLGVSTVTLRRRIRHGRVRALRTHHGRGGRLRLLRSDVARLLVEMSGAEMRA